MAKNLTAFDDAEERCDVCGSPTCAGHQHPDTERLDWLQSLNSVRVDYYLRDGKRVYVVYDMARARPLGNGKTIRECIDNARGRAGVRAYRVPEGCTRPAECDKAQECTMPVTEYCAAVFKPWPTAGVKGTLKGGE